MPTTRKVRWAVMHLTIAFIVCAFGLLTRFGEIKLSLIVVSTFLGMLAIFEQRFYWTPRLMVAIGAVYIALFLLEGLLHLTAPRTLLAKIGLQGLFTTDPTTGYRLSANWSGVYDDGIVKGARYETNSLGHRDDEPSAESHHRVFLIGDSFAFGNLLDQSETIDKQIERQSEGKLDAYNLGVGGYGPPACLESLRRCSLTGAHVIYFFFENDLRNDNLLLGRSTVVDGHLVPKANSQGVPYTREELLAKIRRITEGAPGGWQVIKLTRIRKRIRSAFGTSVPSPPFHYRGTAAAGNPLLRFDIGNVEAARDETMKMRELAETRAMKFSVLIIPTTENVRYQRYAPRTNAYLTELRRVGVSVIEVLPQLTPDHFIPHDGHFNASGASITAGAIVQYLNSQPEDESQ